MQLSRLIPHSLRRSALYQRASREYKVNRLHKQLATAQLLNVVVGSASTSYPGWFQTDQEVLDITSPNDWCKLFAPESIDRLLAEHVLEHLTEAECRIALGEAFRYLKQGGLFRIAVPDGYRRDAPYVAEVSPPNAGHQVLYNMNTLVPLLEGVGFAVEPLEYFDEQENFHARPWDENEGMITRSHRFDKQQDFQRGELFYTSLIVDARKP